MEINAIIKELEEKGYEATARTVEKLDHKEEHITILSKDGEKLRVSPSINVSDVKNMPESELETVVTQILATLDNALKEAESYKYEKLPNLFNYEEIESKLFVRVCNAEKVTDRMVGARIENIFAALYIKVAEDMNGCSSTAVTKEMLSMWEKTEKELYVQAISNMEKWDCVIEPLYSMMPAEIVSFMSEEEKENAPYIMTNKASVNGANTILVPKFLKKVKDCIGDFFILPSSKHEVLCLPVKDADPEELLKMVKEVNATQVSEEDFLADSVYGFIDGSFSKVAG